MNLRAHTYDLIIDPLLAGLKKSVKENIPAGVSVIDVACGTGSLALSVASVAVKVTGIDLDNSLIDFAVRRAIKRKVYNAEFLVKDAACLQEYGERQFGVAVTSMAIHQFEEDLAISILKEMKRIAGKVIIADYNFPMPPGFSQEVAYVIERFAGGDHYRNFRNYMSKGGLEWFAGSAGLRIRPLVSKVNRIFTVVDCI